MKKLARELVNRMPQLTARKNADAVLANAQQNQPLIKRTILDLAQADAASESAIVIGAGPSLHRQNSISQILKSGYNAPIIAAEGALGHCLRGGLVPDYVMTLDPGPIPTGPDRMLRWYGDPGLTLEKLDQDDYFRRQDLDTYLGHREMERNQELVELVDRNGPAIKVVMATSIPPVVPLRCLQAGMELYWWNPLFDDVDDPDSLSAKLYHLNKAPCMVSGGNCGAAAWVFAHSVLGKKHVAVVGMDFSYAPETPLSKTPYYKDMEEIFGERAAEAFITVRNPYLSETWFTDPTYYWYRQSFLAMARKAGCVTFNCTEGGILFGKGVQFTGLEEFLRRHGHTATGEGTEGTKDTRGEQIG